MTATKYYKQIVLDASFSGTGINWANTYVGLSSGPPSSSTSEVAGEITASEYVRIAFTPSLFDDVDADITNTTEYVWTAESNWGSIGCAFLSDSSQGGKALIYGTFDSESITSGTIIRIPIGNLSVS